jgi:hypothetical protein
VLINEKPIQGVRERKKVVNRCSTETADDFQNILRHYLAEDRTVYNHG